MWRMMRPESGPGMFIWVNPSCEEPHLYRVEKPQLKAGVLEYQERDDQGFLGMNPPNYSSPDERQESFEFLEEE